MRLDRRWLHVLGLALFVIVTGYALYRQPVVLREIDPLLILAGLLLASAATLLQGLHTYVFLGRREMQGRLLLATWLSAERAWLNTAFPAKAGTIATVAVISGKLKLGIASYLRFSGLSAGITAAISVVGAALMLLDDPWLRVAAVASMGLLLPLSRLVHPVRTPELALLVASAGLNLVAISLGIAVCILGLGHDPLSLQDAISVGLALNLLSIVSITPGNFGVRELALALIAPLLGADVEVVLQGSACYVVLRLGASALIALVLRARALSALPSQASQTA